METFQIRPRVRAPAHSVGGPFPGEERIPPDGFLTGVWTGGDQSKQVYHGTAEKGSDVFPLHSACSARLKPGNQGAAEGPRW